MTDDVRLGELRAEVRYRRTRLALLRARMYGKPSTTAGKALAELERALAGAQDRLRRAEQKQAAQDQATPDTGA